MALMGVVVLCNRLIGRSSTAHGLAVIGRCVIHLASAALNG